MTDSTERALVLGSNGQDGTYLVRHLLRRGYRVTGADLAPQSRFEYEPFAYRAIDLRDPASVTAMLERDTPDIVFHAAAVHASAADSSATMYEENFPAMLAVNTGSVQSVLEYFRVRRPAGRLVYLSSGKMFGPDYPEMLSESSPQYRKCLYTVTKGAAGDLIAYYRDRHQVRASILYPFPHESELRPPEFFIPKLIAALVAAKAGRKEKTSFFSLDFFADWGSADEYMDIAIDVAERAMGQDFTQAFGKSWNGRDLARTVFAAEGLDYRDFLEAPAPGSAARRFSISTQKLRAAIGRVPQIDIADFIIAAARDYRRT